MQKGFTVIELLVAIAVIGIIATIVVVSYNGTQNRAIDVSVRSDLDSIAGELESYRVRINDANPDKQFPRTKEQLETLDIQASKQNYDTTLNYNMIYCISNTGTEAYQQYKLIARSKAGTIFVMTEEGLATHSLTAASFTSTLCSTLGMGLVSNGMYNVNTWQDWVHTG
jgi:prepilin-type N-terminal cleavage/methylation domain-containing protein